MSPEKAQGVRVRVKELPGRMYVVGVMVMPGVRVRVKELPGRMGCSRGYGYARG